MPVLTRCTALPGHAGTDRRQGHGRLRRLAGTVLRACYVMSGTEQASLCTAMSGTEEASACERATVPVPGARLQRRERGAGGGT
eukprot:3660670-Rhodomonas_salina.1